MKPTLLNFSLLSGAAKYKSYLDPVPCIVLANGEELEKFAAMVVKHSVNYLKDNNADFEAEQLEDFWREHL
jgi:hypothetical protein